MSSFIERPASKEELRKRRLVYGVGINDANYLTKYKLEGITIRCPYFTAWSNMLKRCYCSSFLVSRPTYLGCSVHPNWHKFSNFKRWMESQDWEGNQLDKDILIKGNKVYSEETCIFVSNRVNGLLNTQPNTGGTYKIGVRRRTTVGKFTARCNNGIEMVHLGSFDTEKEAYLAYLTYKQQVILATANEQTNQKLKQALLNIANSYKLEI